MVLREWKCFTSLVYPCRGDTSTQLLGRVGNSQETHHIKALHRIFHLTQEMIGKQPSWLRAVICRNGKLGLNPASCSNLHIRWAPMELYPWWTRSVHPLMAPPEENHKDCFDFNLWISLQGFNTCPTGLKKHVLHTPVRFQPLAINTLRQQPWSARTEHACRRRRAVSNSSCSQDALYFCLGIFSRQVWGLCAFNKDFPINYQICQSNTP